MKIDLSWIDFKNICLIQKNLVLQYTVLNKLNNSFYYIWAIEGPIQYITVIEKKHIPDDNQIDFENNCKVNINLCAGCSQTYYKSEIVITGDEWQEIDLLRTYFDTNIMNDGLESCLIKLNNLDNDEIELLGGSATRDILEITNFALSKIYYKSKNLSRSTVLKIISTK